MNIGIVGNGVVGNATARCYMENHAVRTYDIVKEKATHSLSEVMACDLVFLCLPTPQVKGGLSCNLSYIEDFLGFIKGSQTHIALRSTVPIGTTRRLTEQYNLPNLVHSPEFLTARVAVVDAQLPARNIVGFPDLKVTIEQSHPICDLYSGRFPGTPLLLMTSDESESVKLFQNSFFATKIAFFNEINQLSTKLSLNWDRVLEAMLLDGRISHSHTMVPGPDGVFGYGGTCLVPGTSVATPTGRVPIEDIDVGDEVLDIEGTTTLVTGVASREVEHTVAVRARGRKVVGTVDHIHFAVIGDEVVEKLLGDFRPGDSVLIPRQNLPDTPPNLTLPSPVPYAKYWPESVEWSPRLAWAVGLWLADGSRGVYPNNQGRKGWAVSWSMGEAKIACVEKLDDVLRSMELTPSRRWSVSEGTYGTSRIWVTRVRAAWFYYCLEAMGVGSGSHSKRAPLLPEHLAGPLIGGWLDGDGSYYDGTISGHSESLDLIQDIDRLLLGLGICAQIDSTGKKIKISSREDVERVCSWTTRHSFDKNRYVRDVTYASPTLKPRHAQNDGKLMGWVARVQDVSFQGRSEVIAIETESGRYIANGHLTHNCLPKDIANLISTIYDNKLTPSVCQGAYIRNVSVDRSRQI